MTDKQIIKLKPTEDLNEKIIKEKGNTKCIFYSDDICRKGDKTRDCVNCARVEYNSLYSLNWDNQERLEKIIEQKEQECEEKQKTAQDAISKLCAEKSALYNELDKLKRDNDLFRTCHDNEQEKRRKYEQTLAEIKPILEFYANSNMGEEQPDKTYHIMLNGSYIMVYDPKPARQALQKISEVKNE